MGKPKGMSSYILHFLMLPLSMTFFPPTGAIKILYPPVSHHPMQDLVGIYLEEQKAPPLFYDTFFPVVYEIPAPSWSASNLRLQVPKNQSYNLYNVSQLLFCNDTTNSTDLWASTLCPITLKLNDLLDKFAEEMKVFETFNASASKLDTSFSSCHEIKPHFSNHIIDELEIELYLVQVILDCPISDVVHHKVIIPEPNNQTYTDLLKLFLETHISPRYRIMGYSKYAISTNTLLSLHTTELLDYLLNTFRWTSSINTCNSQRIPRLLVSQELLKTTLIEIEQKVANESLMLTVPISDISNYYKLAIADCVITTGNNYIVRILVPLMKKPSTYRIMRVRSIPFLNRDNTSSRSLICQHRAVEGDVVVEGSNSNTLIPLARQKCDEAQLCGIPQNGDRQAFSKCLYSTLRNDTRGMIESCHMNCIPYDNLYLPYIKRIRSDQFVIVGKSSAEIAINCKRFDKAIEVVDIPEFVGSLMVTLPCSCHITHRGEKFEINGPCDFQLEFRPVRPKGWTNDALQNHFHHHPSKGISEPIEKDGEIESNETNGDDLTEKDIDDDFNDFFIMASTSSNTAWHMYFAYIIITIQTMALVFGYYILRNVYIRIGHLEVSTALNTRNSGMQYSRNAPVQFHARASFSPATNESVY